MATTQVKEAFHPSRSPGNEPPLPSSGLVNPGRRRLPALDGIRALAIAGVVAYHAGVAGVPGGFLGVDTFFTLSGFLITSLLLDERRSTGTIHIGRFWGRRARRLLPALFAMLVAVTAFVGVAGLGTSFPSLRTDAFSALAYVANWHFVATQTDYFAVSAHPSPLLHTWSLAIEEQFYIVWPLILVIALRCARHSRTASKAPGGPFRPDPRTLWGLFVFCIAGAGGSAWWMSHLAQSAAGHTRAYYGTDTRAQSLLVGAALAIGMVLWNARCLRATALAWGVAGLGGSLWAFHMVTENGHLTFSGGFALASVSAAAIIASAVLHPHGPVGWALSIRPIAYLGRISYGVYLWHWPVIVFMTHARTGLSGWVLFSARVSVILAISVASFHLIEQPIRRGVLRPVRTARHFRSAWRRPWLTELAFAGSAVSAVSAVILVSTSVGPPSLNSASALTPAQRAQVERDANLSPTLPSLASRLPGQGGDSRILLVGDSMAYSLGLGLATVAPSYNVWLADEGVPGCSVSIEGTYVIGDGDLTPISFCNADIASPSNWRAMWKKWVDQFDPDVVVYLARADLFDQIHNGTFEHIGEPDFDSYLDENLNQAVSILGSRGARVVLMTTPYYYADELPSGDPLPEDDPARVNAYNAMLRRVASTHPGEVSVFDLSALVSPNGKYAATVDGVTVRSPDGVHFTTAGGAWLAPRILPTLVRLGRSHHARYPVGTFPGPPAPDS